MKKARTMSPETETESSSMKDAFSKYADYLNNLNDKRERVVKASRDITMNSKKINILDYILGLADLTGELMRLAIGRISEGELDFAEKICIFVREIYRKLTLIAPEMDDPSDMKQKMETMLQSVMKIENACFSVHVRGSEYIPLLGSADPSYPLLGMPDVE